MRRLILLASSVSGLLAVASLPAYGQPAFPGAEGFGAAASGGRGGQVLEVTTLAASGAGSLQWALNQSGARIIVFRVSGVITGDVLIPHGDVTIAGQTAPGAGITVVGHLYGTYGQTYGNIIVRHLRIRAPPADATWTPAQHDAVQLSTQQLMIFDHVDISHGIDENVDMWGGAKDITVQWSAITFPDPAGGHPEGEHNYGLINGPGGGRISVHHNLFVHNKVRTPAIADGPADVRNNVVYNGREGFVHHNPATGDFNIIGNYYRDGPSASLAPLWFDPENEPAPTRYWVWNNWVDDPGEFEGRVDNPYTTPGFDSSYTFACCGIESSQFNSVGEFDFTSTAGYVPISTQDPLTAYQAVLAGAGAWPRDVLNQRAVDETLNRNGAWSNDRPSDWLEGLTPTTPPTDDDHDGMADPWELSRGLDPTNGGDHTTVMPSGYTAVEEYINQLADQLHDPQRALSVFKAQRRRERSTGGATRRSTPDARR